MKKVSKIISQELAPNSHRILFLDIAVFNILIMLAFAGILIFMPAISSYKIKANIMDFTRTIHLMNITWIVISCFIMKVFGYKLPVSLRFFFGLKFAGLLVLAIVILVFSSTPNDPQSWKIGEYKHVVTSAFSITYLSYVFIFMAFEKSAIALILVSIILLCINIYLQIDLNYRKNEFLNIHNNTITIDNAFKQLIKAKEGFHPDFNEAIDAIKAVAKQNNININMLELENFKEHPNILFENENYDSYEMILNKINANSNTYAQKFKKMKVFYLVNFQIHFNYSRAWLKKFINKQLELYELLKNRKFNKDANEVFVNSYKDGIEAEKIGLNQILISLESLTDCLSKDYRIMRGIVLKNLGNSLSKVQLICNAFNSNPSKLVSKL